MEKGPGAHVVPGRSRCCLQRTTAPLLGAALTFFLVVDDKTTYIKPQLSGRRAENLYDSLREAPEGQRRRINSKAAHFITPQQSPAMWPLAKGGRGPATKTPKKSGGGHAGRAGARDPTVAAIRKLEKKRSERRRSASEYKQARSAEERRNERMGRPGDVDFQRMIKKFRREHVDVDTSVRAAAQANAAATPVRTRVAAM